MAGDTSLREIEEAEEGKHFVAAFRGRTVRGTKIDLPAGFAGVTLSSLDSTPSESSTSALAENGRRTRSNKAPLSQRARQAAEELEEDAEAGMPVDEVDQGPVKVLQATGTFSSFMLWHPDIPVDEGRDEYVRSLTEWTKIAAEVSLHTRERRICTDGCET